MDSEYVPIRDVVKVEEDYEEFINDLTQNIEDRNIPDWLLIPKRKSGEHATGGAWLGIVMSVCSSGGGSNIDARIAVDVSERDRVMSDVSDVPDVIAKYISAATEAVDRPVDMCIARIRYDSDSFDLDGLELLLRMEEEEIIEE